MKNITNPVKKLAVAMLGCMMIGCGDKLDSSKNVDLQERASFEGTVLNLYSWEEYFDPATIEAFEEKTGAKVVYKTFESTDEMEAKLLSQPGEYDVVVAEGQDLEKLRELNLIRDLDRSRIPNLANIGDEFRGMPFDLENKIAAPYLWGTTLIAYRTDVIPNPEKSWALLWDPRVKGKVMLHDERHSVIRIQMFSLGHSFNTAEPEFVEQATETLLSGIAKSGARLGSDADVRKGLTDGSLYAAMCYSGDAAMVAEVNESIGWYIPAEGAPLWIDCFAIAQNSTNPDLAHAFLDHMLDAEVGAKNANAVWFATPNKASMPFVNPDLLADESIYPPPHVMDLCRWHRKVDPKVEIMFNEGWLKVLEKVRSETTTAALSTPDPE